QAQKLRPEMRATNALGISGDREKRKYRCDPDDLKKGLRKRERKNPGQFYSAVWPREKQNAPNQIGNVINKRGQGGSELRVQGKIVRHPASVGFCQVSAGKLRCQSRE